MDMDDLYMEAHDELIQEYMDEHPGATEDQAYEATLDLLDDRVIDMYSGMIDHAYELSRGYHGA